MSRQQEEVFELVHADWAAIVHEPSSIQDWEVTFQAMAREMQHLRASGHWRTGGRTLLHALGIHRDEVRLCRALAWLMTPDGWHGLGDMFLRRLLARVGVDVLDTSAASVATEVARAGTRADIVARVGSRTVLIEAKVWAGEQIEQADRLAAGWSGDSATLVFLTRDGRAPSTAIDSDGEWVGLAWRDVASILSRVVTDQPECSPGVRDVLETLQRYGG